MLRVNRRLVVIVVGTMLFAACSDSKSAALNLGTSPAATAPGTVPLTTEAPTTTSAPSTTSPTAETPLPSTIAASPEDQVKADFLAAMAVRRQCSYDPVGCDFASVAVAGSPMDNFLRDLMKQRIDANLRLVGPDTSTLTVTTVRVVDASTAEVATCIYDPVVMYDVAKPDDPSDDIVFDENEYSTRSSWKLTKVDSRWRIADGSVEKKSIGANRCAG